MVGLEPHTIHEREVKPAELAVRIFTVVVVAIALDGAAAASGEDDWELPGVVGIAIKETARQHDHAVVQERSFAFVRGLHFGEEFSPQFDLEFVDLLIHGEAVFIACVVGQFMDTTADAIETGEAHVR